MGDMVSLLILTTDTGCWVPGSELLGFFELLGLISWETGKPEDIGRRMVFGQKTDKVKTITIAVGVFLFSPTLYNNERDVIFRV